MPIRVEMGATALRRDIADMEQQLLRQCEIIEVAENLVSSADTAAAVAGDASGMDLLRLPLLTEATAQTLRIQAEAFEAWAERVAPLDPLLRRALQKVAAALVDAGNSAAVAAEHATEFAADAQLDAA
jgi:hypothetical protein